MSKKACGLLALLLVHVMRVGAQEAPPVDPAVRAQTSSDPAAAAAHPVAPGDDLTIGTSQSPTAGSEVIGATTAELQAPAENIPPLADSAADDPLVAAELAKLGLSDAAGSGSVVDTSFKFSGFADVGLTGILGKNEWRGAYQRFPSFSVGNFNLYLDKQITDTLRMFGEVRFTFLPNGSDAVGSVPGQYTSTATQDYADFKRPLRWAGIYIPRVYIEWRPYRYLAFRAGVFLTPYGIWNVDHGSPTVITVEKPFVVGEALFPDRQTGLEIFGNFDVGTHSTLGYHLTLSNGTGAISEYRDLDANKAVGGRVYWSYDGLGELRVGGSAYYGTDTSAQEVAAIAPDGKHVAFTQQINSKSDILALAADVQWKYAGLHLQAEVITQQRRFAENGRVGTNNPLFGRYIAPMDKLSWGVYGLAGYRFEWFGIMPYVLVQSIDTDDLDASMRFLVNSFFVGLNIRPVDSLVFKLEYNHSHFPRGFFVEGDFHMAQGQIAWAF